MSKKQFIAFFVLLSAVSFLYVFNTIDTMVSRERCSNYAMARTMDSFSGLMKDTSDKSFSQKLEVGVAQEAKANYDFFYNFCMDQKEVSR